MNYIVIVISALYLQISMAQEIKLIHYNIKELDSVKLKKPIDSKQLQSVKDILTSYEYNVISLNEIQYDLKGIPNKSYNTHAKNVEIFLNFLDKSNKWDISFNQANTGNNAQKKADGSFYQNPNTENARKASDQINFGTMPGQYSTAIASQFKIRNQIIINDIKWKEFNPKLDLSLYQTANGNKFPEDIPLFDKNLSDITVNIDGKDLHIIALHTVPAYHFGNSKTINYIRNQDQLRFLEWYLTGKTDIKIELNQYKPLKENAYYIAVGDFNTDIKNKKNPGSQVLRRLINKTSSWLPLDKMSFTNESDSYHSPMRLMLDYIITSKNITTIDAKIIHPNLETDLIGCDIEETKIKEYKNHTAIKFENDKKETCYIKVHNSYLKFKQASDHYPIWGHFKLE